MAVTIGLSRNNESVVVCHFGHHQTSVNFTETSDESFKTIGVIINELKLNFLIIVWRKQT